MNKIAQFIKTKRKEAGLTQEEFAMRSGLGLRFVRELEQGKEQLMCMSETFLQDSFAKPMRVIPLPMTALTLPVKTQVLFHLHCRLAMKFTAQKHCFLFLTV